MAVKNAVYPFQNKELSYEERLSDLLSRLTLDEKIKMLSTHHNAVPRLGIKSWYIGTECARGYVTHDNEKPSTVFPQPIGMASMFDKKLMKRIGEIASDEFRAYYNKNGGGGLMIWGPTVDMERDPRWGRTEEAYGEDPFLTGEMSSAYTLGLRGEDRVMKTIPTLKHFCADNNEKERGSCSANLSPRTKHEYYYAAFKPSIVKGGAYSMMAAYNELSGVPAILNPELRSVVKDEWGLGFVVSDGGDFSQNVTAHKFVESHAESLALSIKAGCDVMTDNEELVHGAAYEALKLGLINEADIDMAIGNSLMGRFRLGEFDGGTVYDSITTDCVNCDEYKKVNLLAAKEGVTLLKNEGILPLEKNKTVALIGPVADKNLRDWYTGYSDYLVSVKNGLTEKLGSKKIFYDNGYDIIAIKSLKNGKYLTVDKSGKISFSSDKIGKRERFELHDWDFDVINLFSVSENKFLRFQGDCTLGEEEVFSWFTWETLHSREYEGYITFENRMHDKISVGEDGQFIISKNADLRDRLFEVTVISEGAKRAAELAEKCDYAVVCVGNHPMQVARECYDRPDITLPRKQAELVKAAFSANRNTLELIISSYPFAVNFEKEQLPAIVYTSHAGPELGNAVAAVLTGEYNPAGRTPMTWYRSVLDLPSIFDYDIIGNDMTYQYFKGEVCFPFGHGLSYSEFEYSDLSVSDEGDKLTATFNIRNISERDGEEVPQLYYRAENPSVKRPLKKLCGFDRVFVKSGETVSVSIDIPKSELEFYDVSRERFVLEGGDYLIMLGASSADIRLTCSIRIKGEKIPPRNLRNTTKAIAYDECHGMEMLWAKSEQKHFMKLSGWGGNLRFNNVRLDKPTVIQARASAAFAQKGSISVRLDSPDGRELGKLEVPHTMALEDFVTVSAPLKKASGTHDIFLVVSGDTAIIDFKLV